VEPFSDFDHVQLAMPAGEEARAIEFYSGVIGMQVLAKPLELAKRGGAWFASAGLQLHLGVDPDFRPARKAHVAFRCTDFENLIERLKAAGHTVTPGGVFEDGVAHAYVDDPFGNRLELVAGGAPATSLERGRSGRASGLRAVQEKHQRHRQ